MCACVRVRACGRVCVRVRVGVRAWVCVHDGGMLIYMYWCGFSVGCLLLSFCFLCFYPSGINRCVFQIILDGLLII